MTEKQIQALVREYRGLDSRMLAIIARAYEEGGEESPESLSPLPYEVQEEMYALMDEMAEETKAAVKESYIEGYERDKNHNLLYAAFLRTLPLAYFAAAITPMGRKAYQDTEKFAQQANNGMRASWSRARSDAVHRAVEAYNKGGMTWMQAKQKALNELADSGITHFVDKAGRSWDLGGYVEMGVRTGIGNSSRAGFLDSMTQRGKDLVFVSSHYGSCPLCTPWQGSIVSISGNDPNYPSLQDAINDGLFHPNCKHVLLEYIEGVSVLRNDDSPEGQEYYAATQRQRHYERGVRRWKNREIAAITPEEKLKARAHLNRWSATLKGHIEATGVPRRSYREAVAR